MDKKVIIMVRVNEYMPRDVNKNVPFTPDEIAETAAECAEAGASIIHPGSLSILTPPSTSF